MCKAGKVLNEYLDYANGAEEGSYFRKVFAWSPIDNVIDPGSIGNVAFQGADMAYNGDFSHAQ